MLGIQIADLWVAAGILLGFQVSSFAWRTAREVQMSDAGDITWLPWADRINLLSMVVIVVGVFALPVLGTVSDAFVKHAFALGALLFVGYPFALAGHYDMYKAKTKRSKDQAGALVFLPLQEKVVVCGVFFMALVYVVAALVSLANS